MVEATPRRRDRRRVREHAQTARDLGQITARDVCGRLVANAELEAGRAPVNELDGAFGLDARNSGVDVLGDNITTEEQAAGHYS